MNVLVYLIPMAVGLGLIGLFGFLWALRSGQYSDVEGAALRVLSDDDLPPEQRQVFLATEVEGRTYRELSRKTGVNLNTLLARKRYAILKLRKALSEFGSGAKET